MAYHDIWKNELSVLAEQAFYVSAKAVPLTVQIQQGKPCVWFETDKGPLTHLLTIYMVGTGTDGLGNVDTTARYIGTIQLQGGSLVLHCYASVIAVCKR